MAENKKSKAQISYCSVARIIFEVINIVYKINQQNDAIFFPTVIIAVVIINIIITDVGDKFKKQCLDLSHENFIKCQRNVANSQIDLIRLLYAVTIFHYCILL